MPGDRSQNDGLRKQERNREQAKNAQRQLRRLIAVATTNEFDGTVAVELSAKDGRLSRIKISIHESNPQD